jgi:pimeloyl-ACP methyl ester carboxylesterase
MTPTAITIDGHDRPGLERLDRRYGGYRRHRASDGVELAYELRGEGSPLTIVNNFFVLSPQWRNFTKRLVKRHRILTYDLRNQGASWPATDGLQLANHVQDLKSLLDGMAVAKTYLLGTSLSTLICRDFAIAYPDRVLGLILVGPAFCAFGSKRLKYLTRSWLNSLEQGGPGALFDHMYPLIYNNRTIANGGTPAYLALRDRFLATNPHEQARTNLSALLTANDDAAQLRRVQCPTLLLAGDGDFLSSPTALEAAARIMPQARVEMIPFAGHVPYVEATTAFENSVEQFIAEQEGGYEQRDLCQPA